MRQTDHSQRFTPAFIDDLIALELEDLPEDLRVRTRAWVLERMGGAESVARLGLQTTGLLLAAGVRLRTGQAYGRLPADRRRAVVAWLGTTRLPLAADYARAVRSLAVSYAYDALYASAP